MHIIPCVPYSWPSAIAHWPMLGSSAGIVVPAIACSQGCRQQYKSQIWIRSTCLYMAMYLLQRCETNSAGILSSSLGFEYVVCGILCSQNQAEKGICNVAHCQNRFCCDPCMQLVEPHGSRHPATFTLDTHLSHACMMLWPQDQHARLPLSRLTSPLHPLSGSAQAQQIVSSTHAFFSQNGVRQLTWPPIADSGHLDTDCWTWY